MLVGQIERRDLRAAPSGEEPNFQLILGCNPHYLNHLRLLLPGVLTGLTRSHETASYQQARWYSAVINCGRFVQTYHGASPQGRAALLEQATQGALDWVRARPRGLDHLVGAPVATKVSFRTISARCLQTPATGLRVGFERPLAASS